MIATCVCGAELYGPTQRYAQDALARHQRTCRAAKEDS